MTSLPAERLNWKDRGVIREGAFADLVLFNPDTIIDHSTYANPTALSTGIEKVFVNGTNHRRARRRQRIAELKRPPELLQPPCSAASCGGSLSSCFNVAPAFMRGSSRSPILSSKRLALGFLV